MGFLDEPAPTTPPPSPPPQAFQFDDLCGNLLNSPIVCDTRYAACWRAFFQRMAVRRLGFTPRLRHSMVEQRRLTKQAVQLEFDDESQGDSMFWLMHCCENPAREHHAFVVHHNGSMGAGERRARHSPTGVMRVVCALGPVVHLEHALFVRTTLHRMAALDVGAAVQALVFCYLAVRLQLPLQLRQCDPCADGLCDCTCQFFTRNIITRRRALLRDGIVGNIFRAVFTPLMRQYLEQHTAACSESEFIHLFTFETAAAAVTETTPTTSSRKRKTPDSETEKAEEILFSALLLRCGS